MELTSLNAVTRVQKATLTKISKIDEYSTNKHNLPSSAEKVGSDEVSKEIVRNLGKHPPIKDKNEDKPSHDEVADMVKNGTYEPNLNSLAESLLSFI